MSLICKISLLAGRRHLIFRKCSVKNLFVHPIHKDTKQILEPISQLRFYSSNNNELSNKIERIYEGTLHKKIRLVKMFSLMTSAASLMCQPYLISKALVMGSGTGTITGIILTFGFFAFATPVMLHLITRRYVVNVDYNATKDTYIATTYSMFVRKKRLEFTPEDVSLPTMSEMMTTCMIKGKPMFMDVQLFSDIRHYKRIMGFDKPMDFSLNADRIKTKK